MTIKFNCRRCGMGLSLDNDGGAATAHCNNCGADMAPPALVPRVVATPVCRPRAWVKAVIEEQEIWRGRRSLWNYELRFLIGFLCIPFAGIGLIIIAGLLLSWARCTYRITNKRIYSKAGVIRVTTEEVAIKDIRSVKLSKSGLLIRLGNIKIFTAGDEPKVVIDGVRQPEQIRDTIRALQDWQVAQQS